MLRDITIGQHFPGDSLVHRFDPRLKLVLTILYIVLLFAASNPLGLALSILFLAVMYKVAKIPLKMIGRSLKPILPIVLFTAVLNLSKIFCLRRNSSVVSCGSNSKGVKGFGTKQAKLTVTLTPFPLGLSGRL